MFLGAICPPLFSALTMLSVTKNAFGMIEEIRNQFKAEPGILEGTVKPDYNKCISLAAHGALTSLILPAVIAIIFPLIVGFVMGPKGLTGFLGGAIITGVIFALFMSNAGGLWDNAKKYVETGMFGGKGSEAHKAAVIGDTVGDPFKDTAGPSLNTLITVMSPGRLNFCTGDRCLSPFPIILLARCRQGRRSSGGSVFLPSHRDNRYPYSGIVPMYNFLWFSNKLKAGRQFGRRKINHRF